MTNTSQLLRTGVLVGLAITQCARGGAAELSAQAFTEPWQDVQVAAADMGVLTDVLVRPGDRLSKGEVVGRIDDRVLRASLAVADASRRGTASVESAKVEASIRAKQLSKYLQLYEDGNASDREVERAEEASAQADAKWRGRKEELKLRELEYRRTLAQLEQHRILAPIDGFVVEVFKHGGEFVSPTDPVVLRMVDLSVLKATFPVPRRRARTLQPGQQVTVRMGESDERVTAVVVAVLPTIEPGSGTQQVTVKIDNASQQWTSGLSCSLETSNRQHEGRTLKSAFGQTTNTSRVPSRR